MNECPISAFLVVGVAKDVPTPEVPEVLSALVVSSKLRCSAKDDHPGDHQAYHRNQLYTWVYPDPRDDAETLVGVGDIGGVEGS